MSVSLQAFHTLLRDFWNNEEKAPVMFLLAPPGKCDDSPDQVKTCSFAETETWETFSNRVFESHFCDLIISWYCLSKEFLFFSNGQTTSLDPSNR
jgi:hypothetical protein